MNSARIRNYYAEGEEYAEIPLDPHKTPQDNAQHYFKRYGKARTAFNYAKNQIENLKKNCYGWRVSCSPLKALKTTTSFRISVWSCTSRVT